MKAYIRLGVLTALVLLLIPLPLFPQKTQSPAVAVIPAESDRTESSSAAETTVPGSVPGSVPTTAPTTAASPASGSAVFRMLAGDEVVTLEDREFLIRTLAYEMPVSYHPEALKAQAVAAYTYYGRRRLLHRLNPDASLKGADFASPGADFPAEYTPEKLKARWGDQYEANMQKITAAVDEVVGCTVTYRGDAIDACYFAISNGKTESAETVWGKAVPYLVSVDSRGDTLSPHYESVVSLTPQQVQTAFASAEGLSWGSDPAGWFASPALSPAGTVATQTVAGHAFTGSQLRSLLGLRSASFSVGYENGIFTFTVHGYGHGVGMSQNGANYFANQGYTWEQILTYYYPGTAIHKPQKN